LLFKLCCDNFCFAQFDQQIKRAYVWNHSTTRISQETRNDDFDC
jgi:hypothetical protein